MAIASALALATLLTYANALSNPFIIDDTFSVLKNPTIRHLLPLPGPLAPPPETAVAKRPMVNLTLALNHAVGGLRVEGYRLVNIAILGLGAVTLFGVVRRTLALDSLRGRFEPHATAIAASVAGLWAVHPLNSEVVNYISQRTESMMGLFFLLTLYGSIRGLPSGAAGWRASAVLSCGLGMACKESMVTAPLVVVLFDRLFVFDGVRDAFRSRWRFYLGLACGWLLLVPLMLSSSRGTVGFGTGVSAWVYLLNQAQLICRYLRLAVWPTGLVADYGLPQPLHLAQVAGESAAIVAAVVSSVACVRWWPRAAFLGLALFVTLAPTSSVVPIASEVGAERRMYLPLAALVALAVTTIWLIGQHLHRRWRPTGGDGRPDGERRLTSAGGLATLTALAVGCALAVTTTARNREYSSTLSLARTTVERHPHGRAYYALGVELIGANDREAGIRSLRRAVQTFPGARFALGTELVTSGRAKEGLTELRTFIEETPTHPAVSSARQLVASALMLLGDRDGAVREIERAVRDYPNDPLALALLGDLLLRSGRATEAIPHLERSLQRLPGRADVQDSLGVALASVGRMDEAAAAFRRALAVDGSFAPARMHLARALGTPPGAPP